jgi:hypothetical protein
MLWASDDEKKFVTGKFTPKATPQPVVSPSGVSDAGETKVTSVSATSGADSPEKKQEESKEQTIPAAKLEEVPVTFTRLERDALVKCVNEFTDNPRKIKRVFNIYRLQRLLLPSGFQDHEKVIRWILLTEQWPLHVAWILEEIESSFQIENGANIDPEITIRDMYLKVRKNIHAEKMETILNIDADPALFESFIDREPIFTVQEIYETLYPLTFNLNPAVRSEVNKYALKINEELKVKTEEQTIDTEQP